MESKSSHDDGDDQIKTSDLLVDILIEEGVKFIFGIPGEENLDLVESLRKQKDHIQLVLVRHEQAAGFMAATIGRLTGQPGVALSTLGPGATNFAT
jgi:acetolactate synthase-1/2/3 large subunit